MGWFLKSLVSLAAVVVMGAANAAVILTSYPVGGGDGTLFSFSNVRWEAFRFRTGSIGTYTVDSVTMRLSGIEAGQVSVSLFDSTSLESGLPGQSIGELGSETVQTKADYQFEAQGTILLNPSTDFWIVFKSLGPEQFQYYEVSAPNPPNYYQSETGATTIGYGATSPIPFPFLPGYPGTLGIDWQGHSAINRLEVRGTLQTVPEPATLALIGAALFGIVATRRRRPLAPRA